MKEQIQILIAQHKLFIEECEIGISSTHSRGLFEVLSKEIELRTVFLSELENLLSF